MLLPLLLAQITPPPQVEPEFARPAVVREIGPSPEFYRRDPRIVFGLAHSQIGTQIRAAPSSGVAFTLDALGGALFRLGRTSSWAAIIEGGYSYVGFSEHFVVAGLGLAHGCVPDERSREPRRPASLSFALAAHALAGVSEARGALGFRWQLSLGAPFALFSVGYQFVQSEAVATHEIRFTIASLAVVGGRS